MLYMYPVFVVQMCTDTTGMSISMAANDNFHVESCSLDSM